MMAEGLIDEFSLVLYPGVDGSTGAPTIVEAGADGVAGKLRLSTIACDLMDGGIVWVRYAVKAN
jgi:riboflavin biosynthesis pyrimidine reductase